MRRSAAALVCLLLWTMVACSSAEWVHPNKPKDAFAQDYNKCEGDALRDPKLQQGIRLMLLEATERCLRKMGWQLVEKE
ncbi:MAG TPA: hypothetical protein VNK46_13165 [Nitrospiraceae bacterium]|jgi:hypothetical protein|nr:hypothetical protein [Nitrospiraceae bacterium]